MYRRYLQTIDEHKPSDNNEQSPITDTIIEEEEEEEGQMFSHDEESYVKFKSTSNFPMVHTIVGEAHLKAARSLSSGSSPTSFGEDMATFTFDPGGRLSKLKNHDSLRDIFETDVVPEFRQPPRESSNKISIATFSKTSENNVHQKEFLKNREFLQNQNKTSISDTNDETLVMKPIRENLKNNNAFVIQSPKAVQESPRVLKSLKSEIIQVLPATSANVDGSNNADELFSFHKSMLDDNKKISSKLNNDVCTYKKITNGFHKIHPVSHKQTGNSSNGTVSMQMLVPFGSYFHKVCKIFCSGFA